MPPSVVTAPPDVGDPPHRTTPDLVQGMCTTLEDLRDAVGAGKDERLKANLKLIRLGATSDQ
uniref:Uncharacterized protein n=1 Tax=Triticum urartu TaxID=4572 RepID=A0A8R7QAZ9_TRIUA